MKKLRNLRLLTCVFASLAGFAPNSSLAAEGQLLSDRYIILEIEDAKAGAGHISARQVGDKIFYSEDQKMTLRRAGIEIETSVSFSTIETLDGNLNEFKFSSKSSMQSVTTVGVLKDGKLKLTATTMGRSQSKTVDWPEGAKVGYGLEQEIVKYFKRGKTKFEITTFMPDRMDFATASCVLKNNELITIPEQGEVQTVHIEIEGLIPGVTMHEWRNAEFESIRSQMNVMGMKMVTYDASKEMAEAANTGGGADLLLDLVLRPEITFVNPRRVDSVLYEIDISKTEYDAKKFNTVGQKVEAITSDKKVKLRVKSIMGSSELAGKADYTLPKLQKYLKPSTFAQSDDAEIIARTKEAAQNKKNKYHIAKALEAWVAQNLTEKGFDRGFATAKETLKDRAGDCTEHSVLLVAMLRAAGIPARGATGLVCVEFTPGDPIYGYHMWAEAYLGEWVPLDAAVYANTFVDATHIKLSTEDLTGISAGKNMLDVVQLIGKMDIKILQATSKDKYKRFVANRSRVRAKAWKSKDARVRAKLPWPWREVEIEENSKFALAAFAKNAKSTKKTYILVQKIKPNVKQYNVLRLIARDSKFYDIIPTKLSGREAVYVHYDSPSGQMESIFAISGRELLVLKAPYERANILELFAENLKYNWKDE